MPRTNATETSSDRGQNYNRYQIARTDYLTGWYDLWTLDTDKDCILEYI